MLSLPSAGSMGGNMSLLFTTKANCRVSTYDVKCNNIEAVKSWAKNDKDTPEDQIRYFIGEEQLKPFVDSLVEGNEKRRRVLLLSLPHGPTVDKVIEQLGPLLKKDDIILDGGNEWWEETERRQKWLKEKYGVIHLGLGVSGGYQSARHGPSMTPSGDKEAYEHVEPVLKAVAAQDPDSGEPCVGYIGGGGSGHHVKMMHNAIEQAILSSVCEVFDLLHWTLGWPAAEVAKVFKKWGGEGRPLEGNFLVEIGADIASRKEAAGTKDGKEEAAVDDIDDKVTQDVDDSEGTGVWGQKEWAGRHVAAPSIAIAHSLRIASSNKSERVKIAKKMGLPQPKKAVEWEGKSREEIEDTLEKVLYGAALGAYVQGCNVIAAAEREQQWGVSLENVIKIWRGGCIISSPGITRLLQSAYAQHPNVSNVMLVDEVAKELAGTLEAHKETLVFAVESDAVVPTLGASMEYIKMSGVELLPTYFEESELDYFGTHQYDVRHEHKGEPEKGSYHEEWKPA
ncbi:hypothetical protein JCM8097_002312 [Rhodosporidiobolus ruineniae]